ncbi:dolichyl-phosphate-mannose--protein mannosyltransferase [Blastococcus sp. Marseille-P5729]|uniref:dolichyl-phosphate-mannose--protein mannosyltransferase n=1 Tax=Blastococcus sp. Marseille-P5729 TaxID=2086582 RepID=UPI000D0F85A6|nr:phospholipid carrier-dependent glycosyltransferase [Blastococcus sp. Marseille-P5729]
MTTDVRTTEPEEAAFATEPSPPAYAEDVDREYRALVARRLFPPMPKDRLAAWLGTLLIVAAAAVVRLMNIGFPSRLAFDEAYYVPEADQMLRYGFEENRAYYFIVHPPFGKWNIALGQWLFGYSPLGWRFASVLAGVVAIALLSFVVRRLTRSTFLGLAAALMLACDGLAFALSRTGILDIFLQVWVLAGFTCLVLDRDRFRRQLADAYVEDEMHGPLGPRVGFRWWRLAAGVCFGLAASVKWSGAYFLALFAILSVWWDVGAYRLIGLRRPYWVGVRRSLPFAFWDLAIVPVLAYMLSWIGWFAGESSQGRHWAEGRETAFPFIPEAIRSWWHMQGEWLKFHNGLDSPHPWQSEPWSWLFGGRPVLMINDHLTGGEVETWRTITMIGNPALWWLFVIAAVWCVWRLVTRRDWVAGTVIAGIVAGWALWLINAERTMFLFYMAPVVPFFLIGITLGLQDVLGKPSDSLLRRRLGAAAVASYLAVVVVLFVFFLPVLNGTELTGPERAARMWLTTWG